MHILVVGDDDETEKTIVNLLDADGHSSIWCRHGMEPLAEYANSDAILLDLTLQDADGLELLRVVRRVSTIPVLVLSGSADESLTVQAFRAGADDYLVKPIRERELLVRLDVALRRAWRLDGYPPPASPGLISPVVEVQDVTVDLGARLVLAAGSPVTLTRIEFNILALLIRNAGRAVSREDILQEIWQDAAPTKSRGRTLHVHMASLRAKLGRPYLIQTLYAYGYRLGG